MLFRTGSGIREAKMVHFGPFWPKEVYFGPFRSANCTLVTPDTLINSQTILHGFFTCGIAR